MEIPVSPQFQAHKKLYKSTSTLNKDGVPIWKEKFREKCLSKVALHKTSILQRLRQVHSNEVDHMDCGTSKLTNLIQAIDHKGFEALTFEEYHDMISFLENEIQQDLLREEQALLQQYEDAQAFEDAAVRAAAENYLTGSVSSIVCPVCKKNPLFENKTVIFCACGLRLNLKNDQSGLDFLRRQLSDCLQMHRLKLCC